VVSAALLDRAAGIRLAAFDVDGVLTDGRLYYADSGEESKAFSTLDGHGLKLLMGENVRVALITARTSRLLEQRARNLGVDLLFQGCADKAAALSGLLRELGLDAAQAGYMGDDAVDLPALRLAGLALTVPEAPAAVRRAAHYVTRRGGGRGAVREACELLLLARDRLDAALARPGP
jgi:3-deoxy-D-manno-octulosonate 8-phosphate phosphatase (KDO 8-P phosphatase)